MSVTNPFAEYAARLREFMALSTDGAELCRFDDLALTLFELQFAHNLPYRRFCEARRLSPASVEHWSRIPAIPTSAFKELDLSCLPAEQRTAVFHSSGTTEQRPSRHFHNAASLALYGTSLLSWFRQQIFPGNPPKMPVISLTPPPSAAPHSSLVHMFETLGRTLGTCGSVYLGATAPDGSWVLNSETAIHILEQVVAAHRPDGTERRAVLLLGTAFSYVHLLDYLSARNLSLALPPGSRALETGGYKGRSRTLPKAELHSLITARLGIPSTHIICEYGMSELSSQAYDAPRSTLPAPRSFQFPPWARAQILCPETGREVADGQTGLLRIFDLANAWSVMAIQTEDLALRRGDGFELVGRAALAEARGCSLMAR